MFNLNKVMLGGNLTRDCENHTTPGGLAICEFGLAVNRRMKDKDETCFVNVTVFGKQAEACAKYLAKGNNVYVEGRLVYETWEDRGSGAKRSALKVVADAVQFVSNRGDAAGGSAQRSDRNGENGGRRGGVPEEYAPPVREGRYAAEDRPDSRNGGIDNDGELPPF